MNQSTQCPASPGAVSWPSRTAPRRQDHIACLGAGLSPRCLGCADKVTLVIDPSLLLPFVLTSLLLMVIPGPNVALIVANSLGQGTRAGLLTVAGTASAGALLLVLAGAGLTAMLTTAAEWVEWIRWLGVAYLVYLGVTQWRAEAVDLLQRPAPSRSAIWLCSRGALMSLTNPKSLVFYAAFLPQFIDPARRAGPQLAELAAIWLVLGAANDTTWALLAGRLRPFLATRGQLRNRLSGGFMVGAGVGLALSRRT